MARKATQISMDAAFKQILRDQGFLTRKDLEKLNAKIDRLEWAVKKAGASKAAAAEPKRATRGTGLRRASATSAVLEAVQRSKKRVTFAALQKKTGFEEKKLRNIIFRLRKLGRIQRVGRGLYVATA